MMFKIAALALVGLAMVAAGGARAANPVVVIETSMGTVKAELYQDKAPITVKNFLDYTEAKHYDGTVFHRVINDFMIQGGGFEPGMKQKKVQAAIKNESANGLKNEKYTLAMARTNVADSATSQFFINVKDNDFLNKEKSRDGVGYCVFGKVTEGGDVIEKIKVVPTAEKGGHGDVPITDIVIKSIKVEKKG